MDRDAAGQRAVPGPGARGLGPAVATAGRRHGPAAALRAERGARRRSDAPGRQAEQRAARQRRPGRADRLRHRHLPGRPQAHPDRHGDGLAGVHRARADPRRGRLARLRPVVTRRDPVRGGGGTRPLREPRRGDHHHVRHHQRGCARGVYGGRARPRNRRAAPPRARGPARCERGRADDHRRAAAAAGPDAGLADRLRGHRAVSLVPSGAASTGLGPARTSSARTSSARTSSARTSSARTSSARTSPARTDSALAASTERDLGGFRLGRADDREGAVGLAGGRHRSPGRRADRSDCAAAGAGRPAALPAAGQQLGAGRGERGGGRGRVCGPAGGTAARLLFLVRPVTPIRSGRPSRAPARPGPGPHPRRPSPAPGRRTSHSPVMVPRPGRVRRPSRRPAQRPGPVPGTSRRSASGRDGGGRSPSRRWR